MEVRGISTKLVQINLHHAIAASAVVARKITKEGIGLVLIQEPWTVGGQIKGLSIRNTKVIWDKKSISPRAAIIVRNDINHFCLSEFMTRDLVAIQASIDIEGNTRSVVIASGYFPGDKANIPPSEVINLVDYCRKKKVPLLVGCDANAHNTTWGSTDTNQRGEYLLEFILEKCLEIYNIGNTPTFITRNRKEVLDITFGSAWFKNLITNWKVSSEPSLSDHRIIEFVIDGILCGITHRRNPKRTNWDLYRDNLTNNIANIASNREPKNRLELENAVSELNRAMINAYESTCPISSANKKTDAPWWNKNLEAQRRRVRSLFNNAKRNGNWHAYHEELTAYSKEVRKAKRRSFIVFCESITTTPAAGRLHKALSRDKAHTTMALKYADGSYTENEEQRSLLLLNTHFSGSQQTTGYGRPSHVHSTDKQDWKTATIVCSKNRLEWALSSFQPFKSPGIDGIFPALLQMGKELILLHLLKIIRSSLALGYIPSPWTRARIIFIPKIGKKDTTHPKSFRPISLTSFLLKTMEKVIDNFIRSEILASNPLNARQHAYRAGRSTETALYHLSTTIQKVIDSKETTIGCFLDIEGAFDNTSHEAVNKALQRKNTPFTIVKWVSEMLTTRTAETHSNQRIQRIITTRGCPQGGVLSPLLWSLVVDELLEQLTTQGIRCIGYADDITLLACGKFEETLCDIIQRGLAITKKWCTSVGLNINPTKTTIIPFTRRRLLPRMKEITLDGVIIEPTKEVKYLGVILDSKLLWKRQVETAIEKAKKTLMICKSVAGKSWGCKPSIIRWMYLMMVRPTLTYGAVVWYKRTDQLTTRKALEKVQRLACICISGAMKSCPTAALEVLLNLTPLHLVIRSITYATFARFAKETECILKSSEKNTISNEVPIIDFPRDCKTKEFKLDKLFKVELSNKKAWQSEEVTYSIKTHAIKWYTDGSKITEGTGAGIFGPRAKISVPMGRMSSIFQAEVYAISKCAELNIDRKYKNKHIAIMTDSQAAIKAIRSYSISSKLVSECIDKLNKLGSSNKVTIYWVPGHVGIEGNEQADELAKTGAGSLLMGPEPFCGVTESHIKEKIKKSEEETRTKHWVDLPKMRQAKLLLGTFNPKRFKDVIKLSRNNVRILAGLLTGHCRLRKHLKILGIVNNDQCRYCNEQEESPDHLLSDCEALLHQRNRCLGAYYIEERELKLLDVTQILNFIKEINLDEVL